jgi:hypothetical protein
MTERLRPNLQTGFDLEARRDLLGARLAREVRVPHRAEE